MDIVYNKAEPRDPRTPSIFLAGPTPREDKPVPSWRPEAIRELALQGFTGTVFVPEPAPGDTWPDKTPQVLWEHRSLDAADVVLFWVPRDMDTMPAMTTNIEFGLYMKSGKVIVGAPRTASHMGYWAITGEMYGIPFSTSLAGTVASAISQVSVRPDSERILARPVAWHGKFVRIERTKFITRLGTVQWYETVRRNTFGDVVSVFALTREREVVLVKSYRVPHDAWVIEKPAGLADKKGEDSAELAARELDEETGYGGGTPMQLVLRGPFDAGCNGDIMSVFFTKDVVKLHEPRLEGSEDLRTLLVPLDGLVDFIEHPPADAIPDMKLLAPLPILQARGLLA